MEEAHGKRYRCEGVRNRNGATVAVLGQRAIRRRDTKLQTLTTVEDVQLSEPFGSPLRNAQTSLNVLPVSLASPRFNPVQRTALTFASQRVYGRNGS